MSIFNNKNILKKKPNTNKQIIDSQIKIIKHANFKYSAGYVGPSMYA